MPLTCACFVTGSSKELAMSLVTHIVWMYVVWSLSFVFCIYKCDYIPCCMVHNITVTRLADTRCSVWPTCPMCLGHVGFVACMQLLELVCFVIHLVEVCVTVRRWLNRVFSLFKGY